MTASFAIKGVKEVTNRLKAHEIGLDGRLNKASKKLGVLLEKRAKQKAPVDTGRLRSSITYSVNRIKESSYTVQVGSNVKYAGYVEFGTEEKAPRLAPVGSEWSSKHDLGNAEVIWVTGRAQPFLSPAVKESLDQAKKLWREAVRMR
tara:strand:+ start:51 stop:491 length:441 start_codon:yes stop_codon:yes gene_type:complete